MAWRGRNILDICAIVDHDELYDFCGREGGPVVAIRDERVVVKLATTACDVRPKNVQPVGSPPAAEVEAA
jgi:hypothetical protein